jgi:hypothetical protein
VAGFKADDIDDTPKNDTPKNCILGAEACAAD